MKVLYTKTAYVYFEGNRIPVIGIGYTTEEEEESPTWRHFKYYSEGKWIREGFRLHEYEVLYTLMV